MLCERAGLRGVRACRDISGHLRDVLAVSPATVNITVKMTRDWMPQWPVAQTPADVVLQMHHGNVLWSRFVADVNALACVHGNGWWSEVAFHDLCTDMQNECPNHVHITDFLRATCGNIVFAPPPQSDCVAIGLDMAADGIGNGQGCEVGTPHFQNSKC